LARQALCVLVVGQHPGDRDDRRLIDPRVVQAIHQVHRAGCRRRQTGRGTARELPVGTRGQRGRLLVADVDEADLVGVRAQCFHHAVDPVARKPEHNVDPPFDQTLDQLIRGGAAAGTCFSLPGWRRRV
jgi:hypothetical protein